MEFRKEEWDVLTDEYSYGYLRKLQRARPVIGYVKFKHPSLGYEIKVEITTTMDNAIDEIIRMIEAI